MRLLMRPFLVAVVMGVVQVGAVTITVGGEWEVDLSPHDIISRGYRINGEAQALALMEVLPVLSSAHQAVVHTSGGRIVVDDPDLAEKLDRWYLVAGAGVDLLSPGGTFQDVTRIEIRGYPLARTALEVWLSWEGTAELEAEIQRFSRIHNLDIHVVDVPKSLTKLTTVLRAGGRPPDVIMVQADYIPDLVGMKALQALDGFRVHAAELDGWEAFTREGRTWAAPFYADVQLAFFNPAIMGPLDPEGWTLSEMERVAREVRDRGKTPLAWNAYSAYWFLPFVLGFGADAIVGDDGGVKVYDDPTIRAIEYLMDLTREKLLRPLERDAMIAGFATGRVGMILSGSYSIPQFVRLDMDFRAFPLPVCDDTGRPVSALVDYKGFAIPRKAQNALLARRLVQHLVGVGVQTRFAAELYKLPSSAGAQEIITTVVPDPLGLRRAMRQSGDTGTIIPPEDGYPIYKNTMWKVLRLIVSGQMEIAEALRAGQQIVDAALDSRPGRRTGQ